MVLSLKAECGVEERGEDEVGSKGGKVMDLPGLGVPRPGSLA